MSQRDVGRLAAKLVRLGDDELAVAEQVIDGMLAGRQVYGQLDVAADPRDYARETSEEIRDALVYVGAMLLRLQRGGR